MIEDVAGNSDELGALRLKMKNLMLKDIANSMELSKNEWEKKCHQVIRIIFTKLTKSVASEAISLKYGDLCPMHTPWVMNYTL